VQRVANEVRQAVTAGYDDLAGGGLRMRKNPDPGAYMDVWREKLREQDGRRQRSAAEKPRRLAKHDRGRKVSSTSTRVREPTGSKFVVEARRGREEYLIYRPTRAAASILAQQFADNGFKAAVREA
jgi:hypothetical protein